jgi:hypothetical protein
MTAQKALNIGKAGFHVFVMLLAFIPMTLFVIVTEFLKIWSVLDDGKEEVGIGQSEEYWDMENPYAGSCEKAEAFSNGEWG